LGISDLFNVSFSNGSTSTIYISPRFLDHAGGRLLDLPEKEKKGKRRQKGRKRRGKKRKKEEEKGEERSEFQLLLSLPIPSPFLLLYRCSQHERLQPIFVELFFVNQS
jgi:hypothetical protein